MKNDKNPPDTLENICVYDCIHIHKCTYMYTCALTHKIHTYIQKKDKRSSQKLTPMGHPRTQNMELSKIKTTDQYHHYYKRNSQNLPLKSPEQVRTTCSAQVYEIIMIKNIKTKFEIICVSVHLNIYIL